MRIASTSTSTRAKTMTSLMFPSWVIAFRPVVEAEPRWSCPHAARELSTCWMAATRRTRTARIPSTRTPTNVTASATVSSRPVATDGRAAADEASQARVLSNRLAGSSRVPLPSVAPASRPSVRTKRGSEGEKSGKECCDQVGDEGH
jgi:hypothetical protein